MHRLFDAFWRAAAYCLHPRVIVMSVAPLVLVSALVMGLGYFYWDATVDAVRETLEGWVLLGALLQWIESLGGTGVRELLAPLVVVALGVPVIVVLSLLLVAVLMTPSIVGLVATRRFPALERRKGAAVWLSMLWSLGSTLLAVVVLVVSVPLWFVPPLVLVLPPLIWGWLTYRVMSFDVLAEHASADERRTLLREHRWPLLAIGVLTGYLGAAPTLVWALGAATLVLAPVLVAVSLWLYTLVFAFSALWFAHYGLAALAALRREREGEIVAAVPLQGVIDVTPRAEPPALPPGATG